MVGAGTEDGRCHQPILSSSPPNLVVVTLLHLDPRLLHRHLNRLQSIPHHPHILPHLFYQYIIFYQLDADNIRLPSL